MINEKWKDVIGYEGLYKISNMGKVYSIPRNGTKGGILSPKKHNGRHRIQLSKNNKLKTYGVHRLVAIAFIENKNNLPEINHKDENPINNYVDNLEWCTRKYNINYKTRTARASKTKSIAICQYSLNGVLLNKYESAIVAETKYGFSSECICMCCKNKHKTHKGYIWKYFNSKQ